MHLRPHFIKPLVKRMVDRVHLERYIDHWEILCTLAIFLKVKIAINFNNYVDYFF